MFGRNRAPASVRARLEGDERVLAWGIVAGPSPPGGDRMGAGDVSGAGRTDRARVGC